MRILKKTKNILKSNTKIIILFFNIIIFVALITYKIDLTKIDLLSDNNLITFITSMLGIFLAIITLLHGLLGGLISAFKKLNLSREKNLFRTFKELKENTYFIFIMLICFIFISIISNINIPFLTYPANLEIYISKIMLLYDIKLILLIFSLVAIKDTLSAFFKLLDLSLKVSDSEI
ncbi:hypothetical protein P5E47_03190 [Clostridium perfringens]|nr:hypothetical protein [Clostridium perfringens]MDK0804055.1 hypothetical protein [Clostridium perfringens]